MRGVTVGSGYQVLSTEWLTRSGVEKDPVPIVRTTTMRMHSYYDGFIPDVKFRVSSWYRRSPNQYITLESCHQLEKKEETARV